MTLLDAETLSTPENHQPLPPTAIPCQLAAPTRPALRYHGGKWRLAPWIISHFPGHRIYTEAYGGAMSVLLRKQRCYSEIYNDLDEEIVNFFLVLRERGEELRRVVELTPFSRQDFVIAWEPSEDALEQARRTLIRSHMGFGSAAVTKTRAPKNGGRGGLPTGFRANANRSGTTPAHDWRNYPEIIPDLVNRLRGVVIENRPALTIIKQHDAADALHFIDPPYVASTRDLGGDYRHEMTDPDHAEMADFLLGLKGKVILCGYRCKLYDDLFGGWRRVERKTHADGARPRTENLWMNFQRDLF